MPGNRRTEAAHVSKTKHAEPSVAVTGGKKERNKAYEEHARAETEIARPQEWVKVSGAYVVVIFKRRDAADKGGIIRRLVERVSPRVFRVMPLPAPTEREKLQI